MTFNTMKKDDLLAVADEFGVEVPEGATKDLIIGLLAEDGVTYDAANKWLGATVTAPVETAVEEEKPKKRGAEHILRMLRANSTFEIRGYRFTKDHPFQIVDEENAEWIVQNIEGFRFATPAETKEYYS